MSSSQFQFTQSRSRPYFAVQLLYELDDTPVDLTGATVTLTLRLKNSLDKVVSAGSCTVTSAALGKCEYRWGTAPATPGECIAEFIITFSDATTQSVFVDDVVIREKL